MKIPPIDLRVILYGTFADPDVWIESGLYSFFRLRDGYGLKSTDKVLDLACGVGRMALPMATFLDRDQGAYYGLDVIKEMIDWCSIHFNFPNLHFNWANVKNSMYFSGGAVPDYEYRFPYEDNLFTFGCGFSIFTHLLEKGAQNYLNELSRTFKKDGKFMLSAFLFDDETEANIKAGRGAWTFRFRDTDICRYDLAITPEATCGYTRTGFIQMVEKVGMHVERIEKGTWSSIPHSSHDEILIVKD